jgi:TolA-binding protein
MNKPSECPHNLSARARRAELSRLEQQQLQAHLELSPTLRTAHQVGLDFDRLSAVRPGDEQLVDKYIVAVARSHLQSSRRRGSFRRIGWLAAAAVLVTSASALGLHAGWKLVSRFDAPLPAAASANAFRPAAGAPAPRGLGSSRPSRSAQPAGSSTESEPARSAQAPAEPGPEGSRLGPARDELAADVPTASRAVASYGNAAPRTPSAAELFSRANVAWRAGRARAAAHLFGELQRQFPGSQEASHSHLSLGRLLLAQGRPDSALVQLSRYRGPLLEEALLGRAQALARLGRHEQELAIWRDLLRRFPGSVYAGQARERLGTRADASKEPSTR